MTQGTKLTVEEVSEFVVAYRQCGHSVTRTAKELGISRTSARRRCHRAVDLGILSGFEVRETGENSNTIPAGQNIFDPIELESTPDIPLDELLRRRCEDYERISTAEDDRKLIPIQVRDPGPIGLVFFGDPHVDDDGCNMPQLMRDVETVKTTPGMLAANVGDLQNNRVGRLGRLYGEQSATKRQAWQLTEWLVAALPWLFIIKGNHDMWSGVGDPLDWIKIPGGGMLETWSIRISLQFPNKREIKINARHDFPGQSMWNPAHGMARAAMMGFRDHLLVAGHKHVSAYNIVMDPSTDMLSHCMRVGGYKVVDSYAKIGGFIRHNFAPAAVCIINPDAKTEPSLIQVVWDVQLGAEILSALRG